MTEAIGYDAARPAIDRIAELERTITRQNAELSRLRLLLAIIEPDDTLIYLPDGGEIAADDTVWAHAVSGLIRKHGCEFHDILDQLGMAVYVRGGA